MNYVPSIFRSSCSVQNGAVLTTLILGLLLVSGASLLTGHIAINKKQSAHGEITRSLAKAKEALLSYAVTYTDNYGHNTRGGVGRLPCPAKAINSSPVLSCGRNAIGYLPAVWNRRGKRIEIDYREYFLRQDLWYAVSPAFRYNPAHNHLNPSVSEGLFKVNGRDDIVAVILHPGPVTGNQTRSGHSVGIEEYLESENADGDGVFETGPGINDRLITISLSEMLPLMERRMLGIVRDWLMEYLAMYNHLPFAARLGDSAAGCVEGLLVGTLAMTRGDCTTPALGEFVSKTIAKDRSIQNTWFGRYGWSAYVYYHLHSACSAANGAGECVSGLNTADLTVDGEVAKAVLISVGREIVSEYTDKMQDRLRKPEARESYLDSAALVNAELSYQVAGLRLNPVNNDQVMAIR